MKLFIKNMVSIRCKMVVTDELKKIGVQYSSVELGEVHTADILSTDQLRLFKEALLLSGLELMDDKRSILVEKIKAIIVEMIHYADELPDVNFSTFISQKLQYEYKYLSNLFASIHGTTIEQYIIQHKIERVKELLTYGDMSLTEIAQIMQYSSVAALANQFKKVTGLTSKHFKTINTERRKALEDL